jgi:2-dehydro-3-deoxyphosphogluconate aldolase / (4S)-4-hydroxy-2-oxoglutarate aldolase
MTNPPDPRPLLAGVRVMPVLTIHRLEDAAPLAVALAAGGLKGVEVTLRTPVGLAAIAEMKAAAPQLVVGAGTLRRPADVDACIKAGAAFLVSPGTTPALADALRHCGVAALPGVATVSEVMQRADEGFQVLKFFPAEQNGGAATLKAIAGPLGDIAFCPTGGISEDKVAGYLALPSVICVGGSWIVTDRDLAACDWPAIEANARRAA